MRRRSVGQITERKKVPTLPVILDDSSIWEKGNEPTDFLKKKKTFEDLSKARPLHASKSNLHVYL